MGKPLSLDLRQRIVRFVEAGHSCRSAAAKFDVSASCVVKLMQRWRRTGSFAPARQGRPVGGRFDGLHDFLIRTVEAQPDITMPELAERLWQAHTLEADPSVLSRCLIRLGFSYKKIADRHGTRTRTGTA